MVIIEIGKLASSGCSRLKRRLEATAKLFSASTAERILPSVPWKQTEWFPGVAIVEAMFNQAAGFATPDEATEQIQTVLEADRERQIQRFRSSDEVR